MQPRPGPRGLEGVIQRCEVPHSARGSETTKCYPSGARRICQAFCSIVAPSHWICPQLLRYGSLLSVVPLEVLNPVSTACPHASLRGPGRCFCDAASCCCTCSAAVCTFVAAHSCVLLQSVFCCAHLLCCSRNCSLLAAVCLRAIAYELTLAVN